MTKRLTGGMPHALMLELVGLRLRDEATVAVESPEERKWRQLLPGQEKGCCSESWRYRPGVGQMRSRLYSVTWQVIQDPAPYQAEQYQGGDNISPVCDPPDDKMCTKAVLYVYGLENGDKCSRSERRQLLFMPLNGVTRSHLEPNQGTRHSSLARTVKTPRDRRDSKQYCHFDNEHGHLMEDCKLLKLKIKIHAERLFENFIMDSDGAQSARHELLGNKMKVLLRIPQSSTRSEYFKWTAADGDDVDLSNKQEFTVVMKNPVQARMFTATERIGQMGSNMLALIFRIGVKWVLKSQELYSLDLKQKGKKKKLWKPQLIKDKSTLGKTTT
ncbi:hypothetical protein RJ639_042826 [Escallonia herrerae]|uniref:Uncharacterized protein n=1 Tax=Escallonia herrerae TaxID=1293975 RepID=A0AA88WBV8_9ASTE|nr:hypothetical protein RJ639_042826 [Escallonia herrerae]